MHNHETEQEYTLEGPAYDAFRDAHDQLLDKKKATNNENLQGVYAKARGHLARLAMSIDTLEQAVNIVLKENEGGQHLPMWSTKVAESSVKSSALMITHLNQQKEIMMGISQGTAIIYFIY